MRVACRPCGSFGNILCNIDSTVSEFLVRQSQIGSVFRPSRLATENSVAVPSNEVVALRYIGELAKK